MSTLTPVREPARAPGYLPVSPCTPSCLPPPHPGGPLRRSLRVARRLPVLGAVLAAGAGSALVAPLLGERLLGRVQARWAALLLASAGVRLVRRGPVPPAGSLLVANHVSWLDVLALAAISGHAPMRMLAKKEVRTWPIIGAMASRAGTVFLDRERLRALPEAVATLAAALRAGACIGVFPESTTRCGRSRGDFRPAAFQAALDAGAPVVAVGLSYARTDPAGGVLAAFVGDDTLWSSLRRVVAEPRTVLELRLSAPVAATTAAVAPGRGRSAPRRAVARRCAGTVEELLTEPVSGSLGRRGPLRRSIGGNGPRRQVEEGRRRAA